MANTFWNQRTDTEPLPASFWGQSNYWQVPGAWYVMTDANGQVWASPNADFSVPKYSCNTNSDGTLVFQDRMQTLINPGAWTNPA